MSSPQYHSRTQKFSYRFANGIITSRSEKKNLSKNQRIFKLTLGIPHSNKLFFSPWKLQAFSKLDNLFLEGSITELWKSILTSVPLTHIFYKNKVNYTYASHKAMAPHSSCLAWKIPWTEEPSGLQSMASLRVGHDWATSLSLFTFMHWRRKWQPTPVFLPGETQEWGSLVGCRLWGRTESDTTEAT